MGDLLENQQPKDLQLNNYSRDFLAEIAKWAQFLSILGFIGLGFLVLFAFGMGAMFNNLPTDEVMPMGSGMLFTLMYLFIAFLYFFPIYYLYNFSVKMKSSLKSKNDDELTTALESLKSHYKFIGIFTIVILSLYALMFLFMIIGSAAV